jgi:hypothetical protein
VHPNTPREQSESSQTTPAPSIGHAVALWHHLHGDRQDLIALFSACWTGRPGTKDRKLGNPVEAYFKPSELGQAVDWAAREDSKGRDCFFAVAQVFEPRRKSEFAAPTYVVHADDDGGADLEACPIRPTAVVETSPGHRHLYWRCSQLMQPARAEDLNRRMARAIGADKAATDAVRLMRWPGTHNRKRTEWADVKLLWIDEDRTVDVDELDRILPKEPQNVTPYRSEAAAVDGDEQQILELLLARSPLFARIWQGDTSDYERGTPSDIDWGMARDLVKACGGDVDRAENIMRRCEALDRDKWDKRRGNTTYLRYTLERAAARGDQNATPYRSDDGEVQNATPYRSAELLALAEHVAEIPPAPSNGACSEHCRRVHHANELTAMRRQIELVNELIQCDLSPVFKVTLLRLVAIVGFYQSRGMSRFDTSAKKIAESIKLSAQSVRPVLHAIARNDRDELNLENGIIDLDARRAPELGEYVSVFEVTPLTTGGYTGFLQAVVDAAPEIKERADLEKAKRAPREYHEPVEPPPDVDTEIRDCPAHGMHSTLVACAGCGETFVREVRYHAYIAPTHDGPPPSLWNHIGDEPHRSDERLANLPDHWPVYDRVSP